MYPKRGEEACSFLWKSFWKYISYSSAIHSSGIDIELLEKM